MIFKAIDRFMQNITGIPFARMRELQEFYDLITTKLRPIIEAKLKEKTGILDLKKAKAKFQLINFDLFDPPNWQDAKTEISQLEYAIKTMEMLFTCIESFNLSERDGVKVSQLREIKRQMVAELIRLKNKND